MEKKIGENLQNLTCPLPLGLSEIIQLGHGSGGQLTHQLIESMILPELKNEILSELSDCANLGSVEGNIKFATDSFVVSPLFFAGGDIGKLSVCGTCNDLAMGGAKPRYLSLSFIIEEGFSTLQLQKIVRSIAETCHENKVQIVCGDTKVVEKNRGDGIYINTSGIGVAGPEWNIHQNRIEAGDIVIISGEIGDHGMAIMSERDQLNFNSNLQSDCAYLWNLVEHCSSYAKDISYMTDPTRGGLATALVEIVEAKSFGITIEESKIPINSNVMGACEMFGMEPYYVANEGKIIFIVKEAIKSDFLAHIRNHPLGKNAHIIGAIKDSNYGILTLETKFETQRVLRRLSGDQLPRIC